MKSQSYQQQIFAKQPNNDKKRVKINLSYIGLFSFYFSLSVLSVILIVYLPVYLLNLLEVNRSDLANIQIGVFSVMFLAPVLGILFDKYIRRKRILIAFFSCTFIFSFFILVFSGSILPIFGLFFAFILVSQEVIKVGVSKWVIDLSLDEQIKDTNLAVINVSANIGSLIPSIIFLITIQNLYDITQWYLFFLIGVINTFPIILLPILLKDKRMQREEKRNALTETESPKCSHRTTYIHIILLFLSYALIWSDKLFQYPFSSWIILKFGEGGFKFYSLCYFFFVLLNSLGWLIGKWISKKKNAKITKILGINPDYLTIRNKKKVIISTVSIYIFLTFLMAFSDFYLLIVSYGIIQIVAGVMILNYISLMMTITSNFKYKTFAYQVLTLAYALSCVVFIPTGTYYSSFVSTEFLITIVGFLSLLALIPLIFIKSK
ncbi:MAG: hypothetical protein ACFE8E_01970 [Candidatus Hodarchaeota archaeon]